MDVWKLLMERYPSPRLLLILFVQIQIMARRMHMGTVAIGTWENIDLWRSLEKQFVTVSF